MPHFTLNHGPAGPMIQVYVGLSGPRLNALIKANLPVPQAVLIPALVDTGASHTAVDPSVMAALGLSPRRIGKTITPSTGLTPHRCLTYDVAIHVPMGLPTALFSKTAWEVSALELSHQGFKMLLGRDILADGLLFYDGKSGVFSMAF